MFFFTRVIIFRIYLYPKKKNAKEMIVHKITKAEEFITRSFFPTQSVSGLFEKDQKPLDQHNC